MVARFGWNWEHFLVGVIYDKSYKSFGIFLGFLVIEIEKEY
jgi:hypothetical protein